MLFYVCTNTKRTVVNVTPTELKFSLY